MSSTSNISKTNIYIATRHIKNKNCLFTFLKVENDTKSSPKRGLPQVSNVTNTDRYERLRHIIYIYIYIYRESASRFSRGTVPNTLKQR